MRPHPSINPPVGSWQTVQDAGWAEKLLSYIFKKVQSRFPNHEKSLEKWLAFF